MCRDCGVAGTLLIGRTASSGKIKVTDNIAHLTNCSMFHVRQPAHLRNRQTVRKQESRANALVGARATVASGALGLDGDGRSYGRWRVESKQTKYDFFVATQHVWEKLVHGALLVSEEPLLHVELRDSVPAYRACVVRKSLYEGWGQSTRIYQHNKRVVKTYDVYEINLDPPAVVLPEREFKRLQELHDAK